MPIQRTTRPATPTFVDEPAPAWGYQARCGLLNLDLVDKEFEFSEAAGAPESEAGKVVAAGSQRGSIRDTEAGMGPLQLR